MKVSAKPAACLFTASILILLPACSDEIDTAMAEGCEGLPQMAQAYAAEDRAEFDEVSNRTESLGFAHFRASDFSKDDSLIRDAAVAATAYSTLYDAAYEPPERNNGASVWRGRELTPSQQRAVDDGLAVCKNY
jgi:hypothetical protein